MDPRLCVRTSVMLLIAVQIFSTCRPVPARPVKDWRCYVPFSGGSGRNTSTRYYYDPGTNSCLLFIYMGTGGTENRFRTENECLETCQLSGERLLGVDGTPADTHGNMPNFTAHFNHFGHLKPFDNTMRFSNSMKGVVLDKKGKGIGAKKAHKNNDEGKDEPNNKNKV
ncbi:unnamed protein product [Cyprideis torosa]|uniref:Uncharacterized protein n=1 Tax=Cyprideis torosa TaxID=163714 RepID=A0A7R8ZMS1_9CRUS|nr:unnamed protein product [Cyprideis torosa]CAG0896283.1 unnamed protein product [Cyprideis torosa]